MEGNISHPRNTTSSKPAIRPSPANPRPREQSSMTKTFLILAARLCAVAIFIVGNMAPAAGVPAAGPRPLPAVLLPYLQNPTTDGVTVCFLAQGADQVWVAWGLADQPALTKTPAMGTAISGTPWTVWKTRLAKLPAGAAGRYQVHYHLAAENAATAMYHFHTLDARAKTLRLAVFNDIHNQDQTLEALMRHVKPDDYECSLLLGDMWTNPDRANGAEQVFRSLEAYIRLLQASEKPMILVRGNHETIGSFADKMACLFDLPNLDSRADFIGQNWYFTLQAGPVWFLALDTGDDFIKRYDLFQPYRQRQAEWMQELLARHAGADAPWRVLLTHMPIYNDNIWNSEPCRLMWEPILNRARLDLEISGHDHQWKQLGQGETFNITFNGHYPDQQDPENRKHWSYTLPWPVLIGGGPSLNEGTVLLFSADEKTLRARLLAAQDGRLLTEFVAQKDRPKPAAAR
jgi:hypothetical protein